MSDIFFSKFDSEYFSLIIFFKYSFILLLIMISFIIMTLLEKNKICRTFRAVGHLGTLQTSPEVKCLHPTSSRREMYTSSVSNVIYHKFSHGAALYTLNGKKVHVLLEYRVFWQ